MLEKTGAASAQRTVFVDELTNGLLDPAQPMLGPVADGGVIEEDAPVTFIGTGPTRNEATVTFRAPLKSLDARGLGSFARSLYDL